VDYDRRLAILSFEDRMYRGQKRSVEQSDTTWFFTIYQLLHRQTHTTPAKDTVGVFNWQKLPATPPTTTE